MTTRKLSTAVMAFSTLVLFTLLSVPARGQEADQTSQTSTVPRRRRAEVVLNKIQQGVEAAWAVCRLVGKCDSAPAYDGRREGETLPPPDSFSNFASGNDRRLRAPSTVTPSRIYPRSLFGSGSRRNRL